MRSDNCCKRGDLDKNMVLLGMDILFLLQDSTNSRMIKRIKNLLRLGVKADICSFERVLYPGKPLDLPIVSLGHVSTSKYYRRLLPLIKALFKVRAVMTPYHVIYAAGIDMLALGWLASLGNRAKHMIIYEVADIRGIQLKSTLVSKAIRSLERFLLNHVSLLVVTSEMHVKEYFNKILGIFPKYHIIENKVDPSYFPSWNNVVIRERVKGVRIGFFGCFRCSRSLEILRAVVTRSSGKISIYFRGIPMDEVKIEDLTVPLVGWEYGGSFINPDNLPDIYGRVDISWIIAKYHEGRPGNLRWARSNRFNESCYFLTPMIAQKGTLDGNVVISKDLGFCLDFSDMSRCIDQLLQISQKDIGKWVQNIENLPRNTYTLTDEHELLLLKLSPRWGQPNNAYHLHSR